MKPELNWKAIREQIASELPLLKNYALLALHIHYHGNANSMELLYNGFTDVNWVNRTLALWRRDYFVQPGDELSETALLAKFPQLGSLLNQIKAGAFAAASAPAPAILPVPAQIEQPQPQPQPQPKPEKEIPMESDQCKRNPDCVKPAKHIGHCRLANKEPKPKAPSGKTLLKRTPAKRAESPAELVYSPPPAAQERLLPAKVATAASQQSVFEITHIQGAERIQVSTSNPAVARQALALIEQLAAQ